MTTVSEILVRIDADARGLQQGLSTSQAGLKSFSASTAQTATNTERSLQKVTGSVSGVESTISKLGPVFVAAGALAVAGIVKGIQATTDWASQTRSLQKVTGQSAESASGLLAVAEHLGIGVDKLGSSFGILSKNIVNGSPSLEKYGIDVRDAQGQTLDFDTVLANIADRFVKLPKGPEQAAFAMNVFGRSGRDLIPILAKGSAGIDELRGEAERMGLVMSQDDVDAAKALTLAQRDLGSAVKGASLTLGKDFIPILTNVVEFGTKTVEVFTAIPQPLKTAGVALVALTGIVKGAQIAGSFFTSTWSGVIDKIGQIAVPGSNASGVLQDISSAAQGADGAIDLVGRAAADATTPIESLETATVGADGAIDLLSKSHAAAQGVLSRTTGVIGAVAGAQAAAIGPTVALSGEMTTESGEAVLLTGTMTQAAKAVTGFGLAESGILVPTQVLADAQAELALSQEAAGASAVKSVAKIGLFSRAVTGIVGFLKSTSIGLGSAALLGFLSFTPELPAKDKLDEIEAALRGIVTLQKSLASAQTAGLGGTPLSDEDIDMIKRSIAAERVLALQSGADARALSLAAKEGISYADAVDQLSHAHRDGRQAARDLLNTIGPVGSVMELAARKSISYDAALKIMVDRLRGAQSGQESFLATLRESIGTLPGETLLSKIAGGVSLIGQAATPTLTALDKLSAGSRQDFSSIGDSIVKALQDPKTTIADLPKIFGGALQAVKNQMSAWHDSVVSNFGGASEALSEFLGQAAGAGKDRVSFSDLNASLQHQRTELKRWQSDFDTILRAAGGRARTFLQDMSENGLQSIGILDSVAAQPKKVRDAFLKNYNDVNKQTDTLATDITDAFGQAAQHIIDKLTQLIRAVQGKPIHVKADTSQADLAIKHLADALAGIRSKTVTVTMRQVGDVTHPLPFHTGGLVMHGGGSVARGLVDWRDMTHTPRFHTGGTVSWTHTVKALSSQSLKRMHVGGGLAPDEVPRILQVGEFVVQKHAVSRPGVLQMLRSVNRMHAGGAVMATPPSASTPSGGVGLEDALRGAIRSEMSDAVAKGVRQVREKLYVDRKRFGRDLDYAVLTDGRW